jgi:sigma-B regulation protein RsbQ
VSALHRNNVHIRGAGKRAMVFAHGFGCDQHVWRNVAPSFEGKFSTILFDHVGAGRSDLAAYSSDKYSTPHGYAQDVVELGLELNIENAIFVGHSNSAMIGALASIKAPGMFGDLVLVTPSPRYIDDRDYIGGFTADQMAEQLKSLDDDFVGWSHRMAPLIMGNADRPELSQKLVENFVRTDPTIAKETARTIFLSDNRKELPLISARSLIMQCRDDILAPAAVGKYLERQIPNSELIFMRARGHCPHMSAPGDTIAAIHDFVAASRNTVVTRAKPGDDAADDGADPAIKRARQERRRTARTMKERQFLEDSLLRRAGELRMHLGRYDMYAVSLQRMLGASPAHDESEHRLTIGTRGAAIIRLMEERGIQREFIEQFAAIEAELRTVLARQEIASNNGAALNALRIASSDGRIRAPAKPRDWYDHDNASEAEIRTFIDEMDRDVLKVVSLYVRLANCATAIRRAIKR